MFDLQATIRKDTEDQRRILLDHLEQLLHLVGKDVRRIEETMTELSELDQQLPPRLPEFSIN